METVKYNCVIEPPAFPDPSPPAPEEAAPCCPPTKTVEVQTKPFVPPPCPFIYQGDPMLEALPTILVGVAAAYFIGMATGFFIFSAPE